MGFLNTLINYLIEIEERQKAEIIKQLIELEKLKEQQ